MTDQDVQAAVLAALKQANGVAALTGTAIGTAGSYNNDGSTIANVFDNNPTTFFDGPTANGCWVGLDFGSAKQISSLAYTPRAAYGSRMVGGIIQASNVADFSSGVTNLYTITAAPAAQTTQAISNATAFRYARYLSPAGGYGNIAELAFYTPSTQTVDVTLGFGNVFFAAFPKLAQTDPTFAQTMAQSWGAMLQMWKSGQVVVKRFYDGRIMPFGEGSQRADQITAYSPDVWINCWHLFCPVAYADVENLTITLA